MDSKSPGFFQEPGFRLSRVLGSRALPSNHQNPD